MDGLVSGGHLRLVLDLAGCEFVDDLGLRVVSEAARSLAAAGGRLTIRSPSAVVRRRIDLAGDGHLASLIEPDLVAHQADRETPLPALGPAPATTPLPLMSHLRRVAAIPANEYIVDAALRLVMTVALATLPDADGVSVSLRRHDRLSTVAASDQTILAMDGDQYATGEGPCVDASVEGRWFHTGSLATETRWPAFTPRARALGINAILSSPLLANEHHVGALNMYSRTPGAFGAGDQQLASVFAAEASMLLTGAGVDVTDDVLATRLAAALETRQVITLAQGVVMERNGLDEQSAYRVLRRSSVRTGRPLRERAIDIVNSTQGPSTGPSMGPSMGPSPRSETQDG
jgi:hypothetical protein